MMSYQQFLKTSGLDNNGSNNRPTSSTPNNNVIYRKPTANYSHLPNTASSSYKPIVPQAFRVPSAGSPLVAPPSHGYPQYANGNGNGNAPPTPISSSSRAGSVTGPTSTTNTTTAMNPMPLPTAPKAPTPPPELTYIDHALKTCLNLSKDAVQNHNKRPFSALLLAPDKSTVLLTHFSISHVQHAESELARLASIQYSQDFLSRCTLVSTWEPCAMCAGTIYWSNIGRVIYAASEKKLKELTGPSNAENMTMDLPCRTIFQAGQRLVDVVGPVPGWEDRVVDECRAWWRDHNHSRNVSLNGSMRNISVHTVPIVEDPVLSQIGEDGEYQADLKVDWMS